MPEVGIYSDFDRPHPPLTVSLIDTNGISEAAKQTAPIPFTGAGILKTQWFRRKMVSEHILSFQEKHDILHQMMHFLMTSNLRIVHENNFDHR